MNGKDAFVEAFVRNSATFAGKEAIYQEKHYNNRNLKGKNHHLQETKYFEPRHISNQRNIDFIILNLVIWSAPLHSGIKHASSPSLAAQ